MEFNFYSDNPSQYWLKQNHLGKHIRMILVYLNIDYLHLSYIYFRHKAGNIHQRLRKRIHYPYNQAYIYWNFISQRLKFRIFYLFILKRTICNLESNQCKRPFRDSRDFRYRTRWCSGIQPVYQLGYRWNRSCSDMCDLFRV